MSPRRATAADLPAAAALEARCPFSAGWRAPALAAELGRAAGDFFVIDGPDGRLVGLAIGWAEAGTSEVLDVAVDPSCRRAGHGLALMSALISAAEARGAEESLLEVRVDNAPAIALYRRLGYEQVGLRRGYYGDGQDALVMRRELSPASRT